jgi:DNA-binding NarL/FixJ family response regulator
MNALAQEARTLGLRGRMQDPSLWARRQTRVLVVDDSRLVAEALMFTLESDPQLEPIGYALDGWEALELISELDPDVLLVGSELVGLDSLAFTRLVHMVWPRVLIIVLAQTQVPHEVEEAYGLGAADYLPKDRSADELLDAINAACARRTRASREVPSDGPGLLQLAQAEAARFDRSNRRLDRDA